MRALLLTLLLLAHGALADGPAAPPPPPPSPAAPAALPKSEKPPPPIQVVASIDPAKARLADSVTLVVTVRHPQDVRILFPAAPDVAPFRLLADVVPAPERTIEGETVVETWRVPVAALRLGKRKVPPFPIDYQTAQDDIGHVMTPAAGLFIEASIDPTSKETTLAPASLPFQVFDKNWTLIIGLIATGIIGVTALLTLIAARYVARLAPRGPPPPLPRPAHSIALERIVALRAEGLLPKGQLKEFVFRTSEILREYLGLRYGVDTLERTTSELLSEMKVLNPKGLSVYELESFLGGTDLVKFANLTPNHGECEQNLTAVEKMISTTRASDLEVAAAEEREEIRRRLEKPAHPFKRVFAISIDLLILSGLSTTLLFVGRKMGWSFMPWVDLGLVAVLFLLRDIAGEGSPGKVLSKLGLAPMHDTRNEALEPGARILRNLTLLLPIAGHTMELVVMVYASDGRRVGDRWAGSRVLDRRPEMSEYSFLVLSLFVLGIAVVVGGLMPFVWMGG